MVTHSVYVSKRLHIHLHKHPHKHPHQQNALDDAQRDHDLALANALQRLGEDHAADRSAMGGRHEEALGEMERALREAKEEAERRHAGMLDEAIQSSSLMIAKLQDEHKAAMDAFVCPNCKVNNLLNVKHIHI